METKLQLQVFSYLCSKNSVFMGYSKTSKHVASRERAKTSSLPSRRLSKGLKAVRRVFNKGVLAAYTCPQDNDTPRSPAKR